MDRWLRKYSDFLYAAMRLMVGLLFACHGVQKVFCGTELTIVQEGVPDVIPAEAFYLGWQESLAQLANLVDPEIPD